MHTLFLKAFPTTTLHAGADDRKDLILDWISEATSIVTVGSFVRHSNNHDVVSPAYTECLTIHAGFIAMHNR